MNGNAGKSEAVIELHSGVTISAMLWMASFRMDLTELKSIKNDNSLFY